MNDAKGFFYDVSRYRAAGKCTPLLLLAACVFFVAGCAGRRDAPHKVGLLLPLTGRGSGAAMRVVEMQEKAAMEMVEEVNAAGGINGRRVELLIEDTGADRARALVAVKRLLEVDYALVLIYPGWGGMSKSIPELVRRSRTPMVYTSYRGGGLPYDTKWLLVKNRALAPGGDVSGEDSVRAAVQDVEESLRAALDAISECGIDKARIRGGIEDSMLGIR